MGCGSSTRGCVPTGGDESEGNGVLDFRHSRLCNIDLGFIKNFHPWN
jgi:hypothetical protein